VNYEITKDFTFSAAHFLREVPIGHKCGARHGHNYVVRISLSAPAVDRVGFVVDYGELAPIGEWIDATMDHRDLNNVMNANPTAENLGRMILRRVRDLVTLPSDVTLAVGVSETPRTWAWCREP
jgi:6-pyruvoyltetrahydropterin/6-carboxytetrahydropterin synthase